MSLEQIEEIISKVPGWLSKKEGTFLYRTAKEGPGTGEIVEIGSWKGRSTIILAHGSKEAGREKVHAIDHFKGDPECGPMEGEAEFLNNVKNAGVSDWVVPMVMSSEEAAALWAKKPKPIRLLWIDGSHAYEDVKRDFLLWEPFVVPGGIIAMHDTFWKDPRKVVRENILSSGRFSNIGFVDSITFTKKLGNDAIWQRFLNSFTKARRELTITAARFNPKRLFEK